MAIEAGKHYQLPSGMPVKILALSGDGKTAYIMYDMPSKKVYYTKIDTSLLQEQEVKDRSHEHTA
mgnify:CR=1 FL=1|jgi:hypothetical protein